MSKMCTRLRAQQLNNKRTESWQEWKGVWAGSQHCAMDWMVHLETFWPSYQESRQDLEKTKERKGERDCCLRCGHSPPQSSLWESRRRWFRFGWRVRSLQVSSGIQGKRMEDPGSREVGRVRCWWSRRRNILAWRPVRSIGTCRSYPGDGKWNKGGRDRAE